MAASSSSQPAPPEQSSSPKLHSPFLPDSSSPLAPSSELNISPLPPHSDDGHVNASLPHSLKPVQSSGQSSSFDEKSPSDNDQGQARVSHKVDNNNLADSDKAEDASMSPTLTANNSSAVNDAADSPTKPIPAKPVAARPKGFFSKILRILVPCVSPSSAHPIEVDTRPPTQRSPTPTKQAEKSVVEAKPDDDAPKPSPVAPLPVPQPILPSENGVDSKEDPEKTPVETIKEKEVPVEKEAEGEEEKEEKEQEKPTAQAEATAVPTTPTLLPEDETKGLTSGAVQPPGDLGHHGVDRHSDDAESDYTIDDLDDAQLDAISEEERLILNGGAGIPIGPDGVPRPLLPPISPQHAGRKCLVLDLDETLVHSSFKSINHADFVVPVEIEYHWHNVYVIKRPGVDNFLKKMGEIYEIVVFTASLSKYADPVLDKLDIHQVVSHRLFRESCYNHNGNYVKDLSQLGRPIADTIILDNSPASYIFHPNNAVPVSSWFNDPHDTELTDLVPFLDDLAKVDDVRGILDGAR